MTAPYDPVVLTHRYDKPGTYSAFVSVSNGQGGYASQTTPIVVNGKPNSPPIVTVTPSTTEGTAPLSVDFSINAADPDGDALLYKADFGDGSAVVQGGVSAEPVHHVYSAPGIYTARLEVTDGTVGVVRVSRIAVVLSEPLKANAGDDLSGVTDAPLTFDGSGSAPGVAISSYAWDFGDGSTSTGRISSHAYSKAGIYTATLTVRSGAQTATDTTKVVITGPPPAQGLYVTVKGGGQLLTGATVIVINPDGSRASASTAGDGVAALHGLRDGPVTAYVWGDGYQPQTVTTTISGGHGEATAELSSGEVATATLESHVMTLDEIVAAGIDVADPANSHVYEATINLYFVPDIPDAPPPPIRIAVDGPTLWCLSGCTQPDGQPQPVDGPPCIDCSVALGGGQAYPTVTYVQGQPLIQWLVLPVRASWLKEFFEVKLVVQNLTAGFSFEHGAAALTLPPGLTLAPTSGGQSLSRDLPDIAGGSSATASWVVRGDTEGFYDLSAEYTGSVEPIGQTLHIVAKTKNQLHVWGGSALKMVVQAQCRVQRYGRYEVRVNLQNVSDVPVYNASLEMSGRPTDAPDWQARYIQPGPHVRSAAVIAPHATFTATYVVYPELGNESNPNMKVVTDQSFIRQTGGDVSINATIAPDCIEVAPALPARVSLDPKSTAVIVDGRPAPTENSYHVVSTPSFEAEWDGTPTVECPTGDSALFRCDWKAAQRADQLFIIETVHPDGSVE